jgi:hypothetical protein
MRLTRRELLGGAAAAALGAAGIYELVDQLTGAPSRGSAPPLLPEQHHLENLAVTEDNGVEVVVPPLHNELVTATVRVDETRAALRAAQADLEHALRSLEDRYEFSPTGLGVTVAWGIPYFRRYAPELATEHVPLDLRASRTRGRQMRALLHAIRFPSDPHDVVLEQNEVAVFFRSDHSGHIADGVKAVFKELDLFEPTSIRKGFAGGGRIGGGKSLPQQMAVAAGVPGADLIPEGAELFLGFTSTQKEALGPLKIANLETLGYTHGGYFAGGTSMHVSHIFEDLEAWYLNFDFGERVSTMFTPRLTVKDGTQTVRQSRPDVATERRVVGDFHRHGAIGHSTAIQTTSRLERDVVGADGTVYPKGTAIPQRADFNTLDNPFFWTARPEVDKHSSEAAAGIHFVVFNPTSDDFHRNRLAMDGVLPDGTRLPFAPRDRGQGFNSILKTTHRQNFLVPPREHRSFPLVELLS